LNNVKVSHFMVYWPCISIQSCKGKPTWSTTYS